MTAWIEFKSRLPQASDANPSGDILARMNNGTTRTAMWDWIPPKAPFHLKSGAYKPAEWWAANGFTHWKRIEGASP